jgi:hypothetical protein
MAYIDYYKILGVDKSATQEISKRHIENWQENYIPISILMIKKPKENSKS